MLTRNIVLILTAAATLGCMKTDVMHIETSPRSAVEASEISVLVEKPTGSYTVIAIVTTEDQGWGMSFDRLKNEIVKRAAALGGDAVILGTMDEQQRFVAVGTQVYGGTHRYLTAQVIVYEEQ